LPKAYISEPESFSTFLAIILGIQGLKMSKPYRNIFGSATMPSLESYALSQRPLLPYWNAALECQYFTIVPEVPYHKILGLTRSGHYMAILLLLARKAIPQHMEEGRFIQVKGRIEPYGRVMIVDIAGARTAVPL
jgi:hypothetical protein